jgi:hypothetical protein
MVLSGGAIDGGCNPADTAARQATPGGTYGGEERYRAYDGPVARGRNWWPWLLGLGALLAVAVAGFFLYDKVQNQIDEGKPVAVGEYEGLLEPQAVDLIVGSGFEAKVLRLPHPDAPRQTVHDQEPSPPAPREGQHRHDPGLERQADGAHARRRRAALTDAVAAVTQAGLNAKTVEVNSTSRLGR